MKEPSASDVLTTGQLLNVLTFAGIVTRVTSWHGKCYRHSFTLEKS